MANKLAYLNARGMASQEKAWLEPPCPKIEFVECENCREILSEEDALWIGERSFCDEDCAGEIEEG